MKLVLVAFASLLIYGCQSQGTDPRIAQLENQVSTLKGQNADLQKQNSDLQSQNADTAKQRDTCNAKFARFTVFYDVGLFNNETKAWVIPADVEPVLAPGKIGNYSHYDPKTQTETIHFKGKAAN
jgi:hypothetical protein